MEHIYQGDIVNKMTVKEIEEVLNNNIDKMVEEVKGVYSEYNYESDPNRTVDIYFNFTTEDFDCTNCDHIILKIHSFRVGDMQDAYDGCEDDDVTYEEYQENLLNATLKDYIGVNLSENVTEVYTIFGENGVLNYTYED